MRLIRNRIAIIGITLIVGSSSGCLWAPDLDRVRQELQSQMPGVTFEREFAISLGPAAVGLARTIVRLIPDAAEARPYLDELSRVRVAIYKVEGRATTPGDAVKLDMPAQLVHLHEKGWDVAARIRDGDEHVWVLYREKKGSINDLYAVVFNDEELVIARVGGRLDRMFEKAMANHHGFSHDDLKFF